MPKQKRLPNDTAAHLGSLGIQQVGFEHYRGSGIEIKGTHEGDYRWLVTFTTAECGQTAGRMVKCSSLVEALNVVKAAPIERITAERAGDLEKEDDGIPNRD